MREQLELRLSDLVGNGRASDRPGDADDGGELHAGECLACLLESDRGERAIGGGDELAEPAADPEPAVAVELLESAIALQPTLIASL